MSRSTSGSKCLGTKTHLASNAEAKSSKVLERTSGSFLNIL
ncbi:hypothetical protein QN372_21040 [Undibacterium sp. RTI2.1]|nr:hypothetical protein [Undibacterium sp. RTI2.1]MEB0033225.1 hypothetical protein [Undibacterium sp. RTI2.1]